jgi:hypothetical protein
MLSIDTENKLQLEPADLIGRRIAVLGISGSGKTNTAAVLIEEMYTAGFPFTIVDIEGEYWGLREQLNVLIIGRKGKKNVIDVEVTPEQASEFARASLEKKISVVLDLSEFSPSEQKEFLFQYVQTLFDLCEQPYKLIIEEAHEFMPQSGGDTQLKELMARVAVRGRKRGLDVMLMSQRASKVNKDVLTQCEVYFLQKVIHPLDLQVYKDLIPLPAKEVEAIVPSLLPGQAIVLWNNQVQVVQIRPRHTHHVGSTPGLDGLAKQDLKKLDTSLLKEVKKLTTTTEKPPLSKMELAPIKDETPVLKAEIEKLKKQLAQKDEIINQLKAELDSVKVVVINQPEPPSTNPDFQLLPAEKKRFENLLGKIKALPKREYNAFQLLANNSGRSMSGEELSISLGYAVREFTDHPPSALLGQKLITYRKSGRARRYSSNLEQVVKLVLPRHDVNQSAKELLQLLK